MLGEESARYQVGARVSRKPNVSAKKDREKLGRRRGTWNEVKGRFHLDKTSK